ncbi:CHASE2 domain-containing protein [Oxynema aestuarii]|uniref:histidine kinase n=1 Tax=Oxynema aestuarii AP17 TaxID=2064643 RepID=A0A6H1U038_9CYAN|nr:CHASE2 domain-containing protein [Oxynema aestuarii]QIZ71806.1 CHASE2 domain-containing protein [Oxynema aestuarii AP17]RMH71531.1 MAG: CHASE2 domain-containing protein [Cyanobacteria bacterium J007]
MWQQARDRIEQLPKGFGPWLKQWRGVLTLAPVVAASAIGGNLLGVFQLLEWATLDSFVLLRPQEALDSRIVIVTISEEDITRVGQWPASDRVLTRAMSHIAAQNPTAIGLDLYRDLPVEPGHDEWVELIESTPNLIGIQKVAGNPVAPPPNLKDAGQVAASDLILDADGKVRRGLILIGTESGEFLEGLGAKLALMYLERSGLELETVDAENNIYRLGRALFVPLRGNEGGYVGKDTGGYQILINFRGGLDRFEHISFTDVLENRIPEDLMRDRLVFIGATAESLKDIFQTPYTNTILGTPELTPGVVIHANFASQIIAAALDGRPMLRAWTKPLNYLWIVLWSFTAAIACWLVLERHQSHRYFFLRAIVLGWLPTTGALVTITYLAFIHGWAIPVFSPLLAATFSAILILNYYNQWQLKVTNEKLETANEKLEEYSHTLEDKVEERTRELKDALENLKSTEAQLIHTEKMSSLGQLVAGVAHEINNPVNFIYANIDHANDYLEDLVYLIRLYQKQYPEPDPEILEEIEDLELDFILEDFPNLLVSMKSGAERIGKIVTGLRNFSRLDESEMKPVDLHEGIDSSLLILQSRLQKEAIEIIKEYGNLPKVACYASQVNQVFMNILSNAIDALVESKMKAIAPSENGNHDGEEGTEHRGLKIWITTSVSGSDAVMVKITDNGPGISEAVAKKIFDPFFTTKPVGSGTGLGLSIGYQIIVEKHGGKLSCFSPPGGGAQFIIEIPRSPQTKKPGDRAAIASG